MTGPGIIRRRIINPVMALLKQGLTPEKLALSLACGIAIGSLPVLGTGTFLCTVASIALRLNLPAMQIANWAAYPVQLALLLPFFRLGEIIFGAEHLPLTPGELVNMFRDDFRGAIVQLWDTTLRAVAAWGLVAAAFIPACSMLLTLVLRKIPYRAQT